MSENKIKSIEKGWGESSTYFTTEPKCQNESMKVDEIKEEVKLVGKGEYCELSNVVYRGYKDKKLKFEIFANSDITVVFF